MQTPMSIRVAQFIHQAETMTLPEKQNLFWVILERFGSENILNLQTIYTNTGKMIVLPENKSVAKARPNYFEAMRNWKGILKPNFEINEDEFYQ